MAIWKKKSKKLNHRWRYLGCLHRFFWAEIFFVSHIYTKTQDKTFKTHGATPRDFGVPIAEIGIIQPSASWVDFSCFFPWFPAKFSTLFFKFLNRNQDVPHFLSSFPHFFSSFGWWWGVLTQPSQDRYYTSIMYMATMDC